MLLSRMLPIYSSEIVFIVDVDICILEHLTISFAVCPFDDICNSGNIFFYLKDNGITINNCAAD